MGGVGTRALLGVFEAFFPVWLTRPAGPVRAVVQVTRRCNLRCHSCHTYDLPARDEITPEEAGRICAGMPRLVWMDVTGGEPFFRKDIVEVFRQILTNTPRLAVLHFVTNGSFPERAVACARLIRTLRPEVRLIITVSIDGTEPLHDHVRGREGSYRQAVGAFRALQDVEGALVYVGTTVSRENYDGIEALGRELHEAIPGFHHDLWHWNWLQVSEHFFGNAELTEVSKEDRGRLIRKHIRRRWPPRCAVDLMELAFLINLDSYVAGKPLGMDCQALHSSCFVSPEADVYPCHVYNRPVGNLREADFSMDAIWARPATLEARRGIVRLECGGCFTPCEAYPTLAGSPARAAWFTLRRGADIWRTFRA